MYKYGRMFFVNGDVVASVIRPSIRSVKNAQNRPECEHGTSMVV